MDWLMEEAGKEHYISGVYNYCDRWCERCSFTGRCLNFAMGERQRARRRAQGEDPDNPDALWEDFQESIHTALVMARKMAEEMGIDVENLPPDPEEEQEPHPLEAVAWEIFNGGQSILERLGSVLEWENDGAEVPVCCLDEAEETQVWRLKESLEVIQWYHTLLVPKTHRALDEEALDALVDGDEEHLAVGDARGTAKLVHECCGRLVGALHQVETIVPQVAEQVRPAMLAAYRLREGIVAAVPGCLGYHRPGLDD